MLIWIKTPYVAIGVLASFVLLLSTVVSEQVDLSTTSENLSNNIAIQEDFDTVLLMDLPFAKNLKNPCSWYNGTYNGPTGSLMGPREEFIKEFYKFVSHYSRIYREDIMEMLQNHSIAGCSDLHVRNLPNTPTLAELKKMDMGEALNKIYLSLLTHSAYTYVLHHEVNATNVRCSNDILGERSLANQSYVAALKQKALSCYVLVGMTVLRFEIQDVSPLFNVNITDLSLCSRRALRDCQILNSAQRFLRILENYTADVLSEPSSTLPLSSVTSTFSSSSTDFTSSTSTTSTSSATLVPTIAPLTSTTAFIPPTRITDQS